MAILVTGATGNVGRLVVDELLALGATGIRALTVDPARAALPPQIEVVRGYLGRPETVAPALDGVDRMYLAPLLGTVDEVTRLAAEARVRHIVDLAGDENTDWRPIEVAVDPPDRPGARPPVGVPGTGPGHRDSRAGAHHGPVRRPVRGRPGLDGRPPAAGDHDGDGSHRTARYHVRALGGRQCRTVPLTAESPGTGPIWRAPWARVKFTGGAASRATWGMG
jgi:hypothetical protein